MFKKMGVVTVGVAAGLLVAAPFASATECHDDSDHHSSHETTSDDDCNVTGGNAEANSVVSGDSVAAAVAQAPVGGANVGNIVCSQILSNNLNGNSINVGL